MEETDSLSESRGFGKRFFPAACRETGEADMNETNRKEGIKRTGTQDVKERPYETAHKKLARRIAAEGFVLLKNEDQLLPLKEKSEVALFGSGAVMTVKGGTGSGNVYARNTVSILEGMEAAGFRITNRSWLEAYQRLYQEARNRWRDAIWEATDDSKVYTDGLGPLFHAYLSLPFQIPAGEIPKGLKGENAVFVLSRSAGEGADRRLEKGDYYLQDEEHELIRAVCESYQNVILVINTGGVIDLNFTDEFQNIKSILYISQPGQEGGHAVADVLSGKAAPGGRLAATWPLQYADIPYAGEFSHLNQDLENDYYKQGIFVGYRYFDSFSLPVRYGFGFGLSYTDFEHRTESICLKGEEISLRVRVKNTGNLFSGKEVVQVYASCPQEQLGKEYRRLCGFAKTKLLNPGQEETVTVSFSIRGLSSFREDLCAWFLEKGAYGIFEGKSLSEAVFTGSVVLEGDVITEKTEHVCLRQKELPELSADRTALQSLRSSWERRIGDFPSVTIRAKDIRTIENVYGRHDRAAEDADMENVRKLSRSQLIRLCTGAFNDENDQGSIGAAGWTVPGSAAQTSSCGAELGILPAVLADGPAGLRLTKEYQVVDGKPVIPTLEESIEGGILNRQEKKKNGETWYQFCTAFPVGTLISQTWNRDVMEEFGRAIGEEMQEFQIRFWLAPGMNIQKNPLCGRNFEYYSEDPLLSGITAASVTSGVQSCPGCGTTIKHFACNSQENNRMGVDAVISERALREIYLKGFEIAVRESQPAAIMTSYNKINGIHSANNYDLCTKLARDEWGFQGLIMTDWTSTNQGPDCTASGCIRAGNDLVMPGRETDHEDLERALENGTLSPEEVRRSVVRLLKTVTAE